MPGEEKKASDSPATYTKEDVDKLINEAVKAQSAELEKLQKIFDERQTKALKKEDVLKKEEILKALSEPDKTKDPIELINEKLSGFTSTIEKLQNDLKEKDEKLTLKEKQEQVKELAEKAGLKAKAVKLIDLNAEDLEEELKKVAEEFPELKEKSGVGGGGANPSDFGNSAMANPYKAESLNLTAQYRLEQTNPALATKFKAEAGVK